MKKNILLLILIFACVFTINAQDTLYIMKNGFIVDKYNIKTEVDSMIFYLPTTPSKEFTFTDARDGNVYKAVTIGTQVWMAENLRYLPSVVGPATVSKSTPYYYVYDYNGTNVTAAKATDNYKNYGVLYNCTAFMNGAASSTANPSGVRGVCPAGWHVPSESEWKQLIDFTGGEAVAGNKLKENGTAHWKLEKGATNESGFTALPGGYLRNTNLFYDLWSYGFWWTATEEDADNAWRIRMNGWDGAVSTVSSNIEKTAKSCRCVQD